MSTAIKERFVDYLFMLEKGEIPPVLKPIIIETEGDYITWDNGQMRGSLQLHTPPYDSNMACLGFALFGALWAQALGGVDDIIKRRMKERAKESGTV